MTEPADYKKTILLPETAFPMKANLAQREPETLARWKSERLYERVLESRASRPRFVFHDGPPYANGNIHIGHVLNKVLKDIVTKYEAMADLSTRFVPGWDCHGLPIELAVERALSRKGTRAGQAELRAACRVEAEKWIDVQRGEFERLGVFGTWDAPYLTMQPAYEKGVIEALAAFVRHGLVYRGKKPVHWCGSCRTALAEAEVEYAEHTSPSIYVKFPFEGDDAREVAKRFGVDGEKPTFAIIWTTTPWTLPANLAIAVHPEVEYVLVDTGRERWVLAKALVEAVTRATRVTGASLVGATLAGSALEGIAARHPFEDRASPIFTGDHVTTEAGTGLVHTAPGHGADDYRLGRAHGLPPFAPVDDGARFTDEVREAWRGKHVFEVNPLVVALLASTDRLANREGETVTHSYPHCWRCKKPIVFRATTQWFIALDEPMKARDDKRTLRDVALTEIDAMAAGRELPDATSGWIPAWGRDRIHGMIADRPDWCISRQRAWGVPIPALHCKSCSEVKLDEALLTHVAELFGREGADAWYLRDVTALTPPGASCAKCGGHDFEKDPNILDVWFESGSSFWGVMREGSYGEGLEVPVDLYLEGSDQHRGWFHSSLLIGAALIGRAPYKRVLTHGFVGDDQGRPYSKSEIQRRKEAGEKVEFIEIPKLIEQQGAEILRLWTAYEDYRSDVRFSRDHLKQVSDSYTKVRNTLRFLLGNLSGYRSGDVPAQRELVDLWAEARMRQYLLGVVRAYEAFDFRGVYHRTIEVCAGDWSAFYLDVVKDRLYCEPRESARRRSAQAAIDAIARGTIAALAPILCFTADEAWRSLPGEESSSVFLSPRLLAPAIPDGDAALLASATELARVRDAINAVLEPLVKAKTLEHRRAAAVSLVLPPELVSSVARISGDLAETLAVASVEVTRGDALVATITRTSAARCDRCWRHRPDVGTRSSHPALCVRCIEALDARGAS